MLPLATDRLYDAARQTNQRRDRSPVVRARRVVTTLPDPRAVPFDARVRPFSILRQLPAFACLIIAISAVWAAASWVS